MPSWLILSAALTFGYMSNNFQSLGYDNDWSGSYEQTISLEAKALDHLRVFTEVETLDKPLELTSWAPYESRFRIGAELYSKYFSLGIKHECIHPTLAIVTPEDPYYASTTEIYARLSFSSGD